MFFSFSRVVSKRISNEKSFYHNFISGLLNINKSKHFYPQHNLNMDANFGENSVGFKILPPPVKSASDKKDYTVIQLDNGLTACLISDKEPILEEDEFSEESSGDSAGSETSESEAESDSESKRGKSGSRSELKMAAAGLCIGVGSFSDPKDVPGMAHFLEHMVFMGSEKFPSENDFDSFIKKGGGSDNASTDTETTCFYFECLEKHLYEALDKFAQFFIAPLMKKGAMTREREAIESEFQMALPSDWSRKEQLLCSFSKPESPVNSFAWGNLITLKENIDDDLLYDGVHQFRKRHYSSHRMTLAIQARLPTETLQKYVLECFSKVPNNGLPANDFSGFCNNLFDTPEFNRLYYVKPTKDSCQVDLTWSLPPLREKYKSKPVQYVSFLMGDEGKGSLLSYLKNKMWAIATSIGNGEGGSEDNSLYTLYTVSIVLTNEGLENIIDVIGVVFSYINLMKRVGPQKRVFDELKSIGDTAFRFSTEEPASDMVEDLCEAMQFYPSEDYIAGSELHYEYDPEAIEMVVNSLQPRKMNVMIMTKNPIDGKKFEKVEKWFGTEYSDEEIPEEWLKKWENTEVYPELAFPPPNQYLTSDFSLLPESVDHPDYPEKVISTPLVEMWYRKDQKFKLPIAYYNFYLISSHSVESPASVVMVDMFMNLIAFSIAEEAYPASSADLMYSFNSYEKGIIIKVNGYNEKLPILINLIANYVVNLDSYVTELMFNAVKDKLLKSYYNRLLKPSALAKDIRMNLLLNNYWKPTDRYLGLLNTTYDEMKNFIRNYTNSLYIKCLVQGNVSKEVSSEVVNKFVETLNTNQLPIEQYPIFRVAQVPIGEKCCRIEGFNKTDANSVIVNYYQSSPFSMETSVIIDIIMMIIEEPLFDILRTKEQLGYHVGCSIRDTYGILGFTITVSTQANKYTTQHVDGRIEEFLRHTRGLLKKTSEEELQEIKEDLIKTKECTDIHLKEEVDRNWSEIVSDEYIFDRTRQEVEMIRKMKIGRVRSWWSQHNKFGRQEQFRKISVQIVGHETTEAGENSIEKMNRVEDTRTKDLAINFLGNGDTYKVEKRNPDYFIQNIDEFRKNLFIYPGIPRKY